MKKIFLISMLFLVIMLTGCSKGSLNKLSFNELKEKITNKETMVVYFTKSDNDLEEKLESISSEYNLTIYKVDTSKITEEEKYEFQTIIDYEEPSIVFVIKGIDSSKLSHVTSSSTTKKQIIARLKDMSFIQDSKEVVK